MTDDPTPPRPPATTPDGARPDDPLVFAASAWIDGEADATERALVASDPVAMTLTARFRSVADLVGDVAPATTETRDRHLRSALAEFDTRRAPTPHPRHEVSWMPRLLGAAAAVLAIGLLGVAVANLRTGTGTDDSTADAPPAATAPDDTDLMASADAAESELRAGEVPSMTDEGADTAGAPEVATAEAADDAGGDGQGGMTLFADTGPLLIGLAELNEFANSRADPDADAPARTEAPIIDAGCVLPGTIVGPAMYAADPTEATSGGTAVIVTIDDDVVRAVDPFDCTVVAEVASTSTD